MRGPTRANPAARASSWYFLAATLNALAEFLGEATVIEQSLVPS